MCHDITPRKWIAFLQLALLSLFWLFLSLSMFHLLQFVPLSPLFIDIGNNTLATLTLISIKQERKQAMSDVPLALKVCEL